MAIRLSKTAEHVQQGTVIYTADTESDLSNVPSKVTPGSLCFCIETSTLYILNNQEEWVVKPCGGGAGHDYPNADTEEFPDAFADITLKTNSNQYNAIANAINEKLGTSDTYLPSEMATAIGTIEGGGGNGNILLRYTSDMGATTNTHATANYAVNLLGFAFNQNKNLVVRFQAKDDATTGNCIFCTFKADTNKYLSCQINRVNEEVKIKGQNEISSAVSVDATKEIIIKFNYIDNSIDFIQNDITIQHMAQPLTDTTILTQTSGTSTIAGSVDTKMDYVIVSFDEDDIIIYPDAEEVGF